APVAARDSFRLWVAVRANRRVLKIARYQTKASDQRAEHLRKIGGLTRAELPASYRRKNSGGHAPDVRRVFQFRNVAYDPVVFRQGLDPLPANAQRGAVAVDGLFD